MYKDGEKKGRWQRCFDYDVSDVYVKGDNVVIGLDCDTSLSVVDKFLEKYSLFSLTVKSTAQCCKIT